MEAADVDEVDEVVPVAATTHQIRTTAQTAGVSAPEEESKGAPVVVTEDFY